MGTVNPGGTAVTSDDERVSVVPVKSKDTVVEDATWEVVELSPCIVAVKSIGITPGVISGVITDSPVALSFEVTVAEGIT